jgi:ubiquinone/menaquinone biosynthesis C-methylase UbiE
VSEPLSGKYGEIDYDAIQVNQVFHDHECHYYDDRFAIVHDERSARQAVAEVERLLGRALAPGERILDVGCGTGWLAAGLRRGRPDLEVVGSDLSEGMLGKAAEAGAWPLVQGDAERPPFRPGSFDLVVARGVIHHLPDIDGALAAWRELLRPGGAVVLLSEPTPTVERHGVVLVTALLKALRAGEMAEEDHRWEMAAMASNLHVFTVGQLAAHAATAGYSDVRLHTTDFADTLLITASYVMWGHRPGLARLLPWRRADDLARLADRLFWNRVLPSSWRHTVVGVLRP